MIKTKLKVIRMKIIQKKLINKKFLQVYQNFYLFFLIKKILKFKIIKNCQGDNENKELINFMMLLNKILLKMVPYLQKNITKKLINIIFIVNFMVITIQQNKPLEKIVKLIFIPSFNLMKKTNKF